MDGHHLFYVFLVDSYVRCERIVVVSLFHMFLTCVHDCVTVQLTVETFACYMFFSYLWQYNEVKSLRKACSDSYI